MKFSVYTKDLIDALKPVVKCAAVKPQTPILAGVKIVAAGNQITCTATDFQIAATSVIPANIELGGAICVSAKYLFDVVNKLPDDVTTFFATENSLEVTSGGSKFTLLVFDPKEYPPIKRPQGDEMQVRAPMFKEIVRKTLFAVSVDDSRPIFKGVYFRTKTLDDGGKVLQAFATNTHRITAFLDGRLPAQTAPDLNVIVPAQSLQKIAAEVSGNPASFVSITHDGNWLSFKFDNLIFNTRLIEGEFPPLDKVLDVQGDITAIFNTKEMKSVLASANLVAKTLEYKEVTLNLREDSIAVTAASSECGNFSATIDAQCDGEIEVSFKAEYLLDFLNVVDCTRICMKLGDKYDPALMRDAADEDCEYKYIVTPVRI